MRWSNLALATLALAGCQSGQLANPNLRVDGTVESGDILQRNLGQVVVDLDLRLARREINAEQRNAMLKAYVEKQIKGIRPESIEDAATWQYGDAYRLAGDWKTARVLLRRAVATAKSSDRLVNDTLRLARVEAHLGNADEAIQLARSTFTASPEDKAPILLAVAYEIVPEGRSKGKPVAWARLVEDAIGQHQATIVNPRDVAGADFLKTRPIHVRVSWLIAGDLYQTAGDTEKARACVAKAEATVRSAVSL